MQNSHICLCGLLVAALALPSMARDDWRGDLHKWVVASQTDSKCQVRYVTGVYRPDLGPEPVWGLMTENMFKYFSRNAYKVAPSVCPASRTTQNQAAYRILFSVSPMQTVSHTTHGSETQTTTQPFNANVSYSDGTTATISGQQTSTIVVPTETNISRSSVAVYMYTYHVNSGQLELIATDDVVFSRVAASGSGSNAAGAELGAGIGNLIRASKDRHRMDRLYEGALKAILAEIPQLRANSIATSNKEAVDTTAKGSALGSNLPTDPMISKESASPGKKAPANELAVASQTVTPPTEGTVSITSNPDGADIFVDSVGYGHTPALLKLKAGKHSVQLVLSGYIDWVSDVVVKAGSIVNVTGDFQK